MVLPGRREEVAMASTSKSVAYPQPLAKYEDVKVNPRLFMATLEKLHATMGTKFMIPIIGGKELDLHRLFVEIEIDNVIFSLQTEGKKKYYILLQV